MAKRVGGGQGGQGGQGGSAGKPKEKKVRAIFDLKTAVDANGKAVPGRAEGKLQAVPANWKPKEHKPLKRSDFADEATFIEFRAILAEQKAERMATAARKLRQQAERIRQFGDEGTRKKANKLLKAREQMAALEKELAEAGIDVSALVGGDKPKSAE